MTFPETDVLNAIVSRVFRIDDVTHGDPQSGFLFRYRGHLLTEDSAAAYDSLSKALEHYKLVPLFREEDGQQIIVLVPAAAKPKPSRISVNIVLFILTLLSVLFAGVMYSYQGPLPEDPLEQILTLISNIWQGWPFAVSLLSILLAHEFGHYFMGRHHHTNVSLPYFIPFPASFLGTMGAFINMKERPRNKRILMDIGIAGPLAGLIVAIPVLILGIYLSDTSTLSNTLYPYRENQALACQTPTIIGDMYTCPDDNLLEGNSLLYLGLKALGKGQMLPSPPKYGGITCHLLVAILLHRQSTAIRRQGHLTSPGRHGWLGRDPGHLPESHPRRTARWRSCDVCHFWTESPQISVDRSHPHDPAGSHLEWMVALGRSDLFPWACPG